MASMLTNRVIALAVTLVGAAAVAVWSFRDVQPETMEIVPEPVRKVEPVLVPITIPREETIEGIPEAASRSVVRTLAGFSLGADQMLPALIDPTETCPNFDREAFNTFITAVSAGGTSNDVEKAFENYIAVVKAGLYSHGGVEPPPGEKQRAKFGLAAMLAGVDLLTSGEVPLQCDLNDALKSAHAAASQIPFDIDPDLVQAISDRVMANMADPANTVTLTSYAIVLKLRMQLLVEAGRTQELQRAGLEWMRADWPQRDVDAQWRAGFVSKLVEESERKRAAATTP
jgi:hypothetical protein